MAQSHRPILGKAQAQVPADLLWAPPPTEQLGDHAAQLNVDVDTASTVTRSTDVGSRVPLLLANGVTWGFASLSHFGGRHFVS